MSDLPPPPPPASPMDGHHTNLEVFVSVVVAHLDRDLRIHFNYAPLFEDAVALFRKHAQPGRSMEWHTLRLTGFGHPANEQEFSAAEFEIVAQGATHRVKLTWEERPMGAWFAFRDVPDIDATPAKIHAITTFGGDIVDVFGQDPDERWEKPVWRNGHWCAQ
jgi:hypothetical protein